MSNNFRNGYTCLKCKKEGQLRYNERDNMTPVYFREDKKFVFAGLVKCYMHGITEAVALRDL